VECEIFVSALHAAFVNPLRFLCRLIVLNRGEIHVFGAYVREEPSRGAQEDDEPPQSCELMG